MSVMSHGTPIGCSKMTI